MPWSSPFSPIITLINKDEEFTHTIGLRVDTSEYYIMPTYYTGLTNQIGQHYIQKT